MSFSQYAQTMGRPAQPMAGGAPQGQPPYGAIVMQLAQQAQRMAMQQQQEQQLAQRQGGVSPSQQVPLGGGAGPEQKMQQFSPSPQGTGTVPQGPPDELAQGRQLGALIRQMQRQGQMR